MATKIDKIHADLEEGPEKLADNEYVLFGEVRTIKPLAGRAARVRLPKLLSLVAGIVDYAGTRNVDVAGLFAGGDLDIADLMVLISVVTEYVGDRIVEIEDEWLPFIFNLHDTNEIDKLIEDGEPQEVYFAVYRVIKFWLQHHGTEEARDSLNFKPNPNRKN